MLYTAVPTAAVGAALFVLLMLNIEADHTAWSLKAISSNSVSRKLVSDVRHAAQRSCDTLCAAFVCLRETQKIRPEKYKSAQDILSISRRRPNLFAGGMGRLNRLNNFGLDVLPRNGSAILCQVRKF